MGNKSIKILQYILIHVFSTVRYDAYRQWMKLLTSISDPYDKNRKFLNIYVNLYRNSYNNVYRKKFLHNQLLTCQNHHQHKVSWQSVW
jgi:hypothetical protein